MSSDDVRRSWDLEECEPQFYYYLRVGFLWHDFVKKIYIL